MVVNDSFDSATKSNRKQAFSDPHMSKGKKDSGVKTFPDPGINEVDEEDSVDETDEQLSTAAERSVDSSRKSSYHFVFLIACSWRYDSFDLEKKNRLWQR